MYNRHALLYAGPQPPLFAENRELLAKLERYRFLLGIISHLWLSFTTSVLLLSNMHVRVECRSAPWESFSKLANLTICWTWISTWSVIRWWDMDQLVDANCQFGTISNNSYHGILCGRGIGITTVPVHRCILSKTQSLFDCQQRWRHKFMYQSDLTDDKAVSLVNSGHYSRAWHEVSSV